MVTVTDYVASTRTCTITTDAGATTAWGTTPTGTIVYSFLSDIPQEHLKMLTVSAAMDSQIKDKDQEAYKMLATKYNELEGDLISGLTHRQAQEPQYINYVRDNFYD